MMSFSQFSLVTLIVFITIGSWTTINCQSGCRLVKNCCERINNECVTWCEKEIKICNGEVVQDQQTEEPEIIEEDTINPVYPMNPINPIIPEGSYVPVKDSAVIIGPCKFGFALAANGKCRKIFKRK
jgi:hypothetical protein